MRRLPLELAFRFPPSKFTGGDVQVQALRSLDQYLALVWTGLCQPLRHALRSRLPPLPRVMAY
jgi:hypothetical protein